MKELATKYIAFLDWEEGPESGSEIIKQLREELDNLGGET